MTSQSTTRLNRTLSTGLFIGMLFFVVAVYVDRRQLTVEYVAAKKAESAAADEDREQAAEDRRVAAQDRRAAAATLDHLRAMAEDAKVAAIEAKLQRDKIATSVQRMDFFQQSMLESALQSDSAIFVGDDRGRIVTCNPAAYRMFGYDRGEIVGKPAEMFVAEKHRAEHRTKYAKAMKNPSTEKTRVPCTAVKKNGEEFDSLVQVLEFQIGGRTYSRVTVDLAAVNGEAK